MNSHCPGTLLIALSLLMVTFAADNRCTGTQCIWISEQQCHAQGGTFKEGYLQNGCCDGCIAVTDVGEGCVRYVPPIFPEPECKRNTSCIEGVCRYVVMLEPEK